MYTLASQLLLSFVVKFLILSTVCLILTFLIWDEWLHFHFLFSLGKCWMFTFLFVFPMPSYLGQLFVHAHKPSAKAHTKYAQDAGYRLRVFVWKAASVLRVYLDKLGDLVVEKAPVAHGWGS